MFPGYADDAVIAEIDPADPAKIVLDAPWRWLEAAKTIAGCYRDKTRDVWLLPLSWTACLALRGVFKDELNIGPNLTTWATALYNNQIAPAMALRLATDAEGPDFLYPHQRADVKFMALTERCLIGNEMGVGKAQPIDEPVLTPNGWIAIGDLQVGDQVIGSAGAPINVSAVYPQGVRPIFRVTFDDGSWVRADQEHLWQIRTYNETARGGCQVLTTEQVAKALEHPSAHVHNMYLPIHPAVQHPEQDLPIDPYALGFLLGDGSFRNATVRVTIADTAHEGVVASALERSGGSLGYRNGIDINVGGVLSAVRSLDLMGMYSYEKFIPEQYLIGSEEQRRALLAGLLDADGITMPHRPHVGYSTTSERLATDVRSLARSLGYRVTERAPVRKFYTHLGERREGRPVWNLTISMHQDAPCPFWMKRKADLWQGRKRGGFPTRRVLSVVPDGEAESVCIRVEADDSLYMTRNYVLTHNTASAIRTWAEMHRQGKNPFPVLVICPNSVKSTWKREIEKFWPGLSTVIIKGTAAQRRKQIATPAHVYVINIEAVRGHSRLAGYGSISLKKCTECGGEDEKVTTNACHVHKREFNLMNFQTVVIDEAHRMKDPKALQTRAVWAATGDAPYRYALTGTPIADAPDDLWPVLHWLMPEEYPSKTRWMERMVDMMYNAYGGLVVSGIKPTVKDEFFAGFDPRFRRMTKAQVLPFLPPIVRERRDVEMSAKESKAYKQMQAKMVAELDSGLMTAPKKITQTMRLLSFASSFGDVEEIPAPTADDPEKVITHLNLSEPSCKVEAFMHDLSDFGTQSVAVFAVSSQLIMLLAAALEKAKVPFSLITGDQDTDERAKSEEDFQNGKTQFILCTISAGGTGITLSKASIAVYLQRSWSLIEMEQAYARTHRIGSEQHESILIIDYVTPDTAEDGVFKALEAKNGRFEEIVRDTDALRRLVGENEV
jgi:superfamily II DNA or RNA helicase